MGSHLCHIHMEKYWDHSDGGRTVKRWTLRGSRRTWAALCVSWEDSSWCHLKHVWLARVLTSKSAPRESRVVEGLRGAPVVCSVRNRASPSRAGGSTANRYAAGIGHLGMSPAPGLCYVCNQMPLYSHIHTHTYTHMYSHIHNHTRTHPTYTHIHTPHTHSHTHTPLHDTAVTSWEEEGSENHRSRPPLAAHPGGEPGRDAGYKESDL